MPNSLFFSDGSGVVVRAEEALIVAFVLLLWVAAIALFFNRWGKIRCVYKLYVIPCFYIAALCSGSGYHQIQSSRRLESFKISFGELILTHRNSAIRLFLSKVMPVTNLL